MPTIVRCPICHQSLAPLGKAYRCPSGHSFDIAKEGYTNLLVGKGAGVHGDNKDMIIARQRFLDSGAYHHLQEALGDALLPYFPHHGILLDAGCGECYYTHHLLTRLAPLDPVGVGIDISKEAVKLARTRKTVKTGVLSLFCAGVYDMPIADAAVDVVLNLFAPLATEEYLRVLKPHGILAMAIPHREHLMELKRVLYDTPRPNETKDFALGGFTLLSHHTPTRVLRLASQEEIQNLFAMTPYYFRTPEAGKQRLAALDSLEVGAVFHLLIYQKAD